MGLLKIWDYFCICFQCDPDLSQNLITLIVNILTVMKYSMLVGSDTRKKRLHFVKDMNHILDHISRFSEAHPGGGLRSMSTQFFYSVMNCTK